VGEGIIRVGLCLFSALVKLTLFIRI